MDMIPQDAPLKQCTSCPNSYPATSEFFYTNGARLRSQCRECVKALRRADRENRTEYMRGYRKNEQWKERNKEYCNRYRQAHLEEHLERKRRYHETHKEEANQHKRERRKEHPELYALTDRVHKHRRRAQKLASGGTHTPQQLQEQKTRQKNKCYYCKAKLTKEWHADHCVPLSRGGSNDISNIVIACAPCNMSKHDKLPHEWPEGGRLF